MKKIVWLLLLISHLSYSQYIKAEYVEVLSTNIVSEIKNYLYVDTVKNKSIYLKNPSEFKIIKDTITQESDIFAFPGRITKFDYLSLEPLKKEIFIYKDNLKKIYKIEDTYPDLQWKLVNETKKIQDIEVFKAVTTYRGNTWEVWYAPSIPYGFGPWKLHGLPGLIIEANDKKKSVRYYLTGLSQTDSCNDCVYEYNKDIKDISLKEFLLLNDDNINLKSRRELGRDEILVSEKVNFLIHELEFEFPIKFSWEDESKK